MNSWWRHSWWKVARAPSLGFASCWRCERPTLGGGVGWGNGRVRTHAASSGPVDACSVYPGPALDGAECNATLVLVGLGRHREQEVGWILSSTKFVVFGTPISTGVPSKKNTLLVGRDFVLHASCDGFAPHPARRGVVGCHNDRIQGGSRLRAQALVDGAGVDLGAMSVLRLRRTAQV